MDSNGKQRRTAECGNLLKSYTANCLIILFSLRAGIALYKYARLLANGQYQQYLPMFYLFICFQQTKLFCGY